MLHSKYSTSLVVNQSENSHHNSHSQSSQAEFKNSAQTWYIRYISHVGFTFKKPKKTNLPPRHRTQRFVRQDMLWNEDPEGSPHESRHVVCATAQFQREKAAAKAAKAAEATSAGALFETPGAGGTSLWKMDENGLCIDDGWWFAYEKMMFYSFVQVPEGNWRIIPLSNWLMAIFIPHDLG